MFKQTSRTLSSFLELKEVCIQLGQVSRNELAQRWDIPPHADTHSVCRGEGEEASQLSWLRPEMQREGGSLRPWLPLDPTHRQKWCHKLIRLQRGFFLGGPPPGWTNHTAKVTDPNVSCMQCTINMPDRPEMCVLSLSGLPRQEAEAEAWDSRAGEPSPWV